MYINISCISNCANCDTKPIRLPPSPETCLIHNNFLLSGSYRTLDLMNSGKVYKDWKVCRKSNQVARVCDTMTLYRAQWQKRCFGEWSSAMSVCACVIRGDISGFIACCLDVLAWGLTFKLSPHLPPGGCHLLFELTRTHILSELSKIYYSWGQLWRHLLKDGDVLKLWHVERRKKVTWVQFGALLLFTVK